MSMSTAAPSAPRLHVVAAGTGPVVACLHSSGSSASQWRPLVTAREKVDRLFAFDFYGHGRSPDWAGADYTLARESAAVLRELPAGAPVHLVGHSFGGAVALDIAARHPGRVASVTVFEPVLFGLLDRRSPAYREIAKVGLGIVDAVRGARPAQACAAFIDYWNGGGAWQALLPDQQARVEARIGPVARHFEALFADPLPFDALRAIAVPTLVLCGADSPAPARAVCDRLVGLPQVALEVMGGMAHMGPTTHADRVNRRISAHLDDVPAYPLAA